MKIVEVKEKAMLLDDEELKKLRLLVQRGAMNLNEDEDDLRRFAEYFGIEISQL